MTQSTVTAKLIAVKQALADKYRSLAEVAKSNEKQRFFSSKSKKYQTQADHMG